MHAESPRERLREKILLLHAVVREIEQLHAELVAPPTPRRKFRGPSANPWTADVRQFIAALDPARRRFTMAELVAALGLQSDPHLRGIVQQLGGAIAAEGWIRREGTPRPHDRKARFYERPR